MVACTNSAGWGYFAVEVVVFKAEALGALGASIKAKVFGDLEAGGPSSRWQHWCFLQWIEPFRSVASQPVVPVLLASGARCGVYCLG